MSLHRSRAFKIPRSLAKSNPFFLMVSIRHVLLQNIDSAAGFLARRTVFKQACTEVSCFFRDTDNINVHIRGGLKVHPVNNPRDKQYSAPLKVVVFCSTCGISYKMGSLGFTFRFRFFGGGSSISVSSSVSGLGSRAVTENFVLDAAATGESARVRLAIVSCRGKRRQVMFDRRRCHGEGSVTRDPTSPMSRLSIQARRWRAIIVSVPIIGATSRKHPSSQWGMRDS